MAAQERKGSDPLIPIFRDLLHNPNPQLPANGSYIAPNNQALQASKKPQLRNAAAARLLQLKAQGATAFSTAPSLLILEADAQPLPGLPAFQTAPQLAALAEHTNRTDGSTSDASFHYNAEQPVVARCSAGKFAVTFSIQVNTRSKL